MVSFAHVRTCDVDVYGAVRQPLWARRSLLGAVVTYAFAHWVSRGRSSPFRLSEHRWFHGPRLLRLLQMGHFRVVSVRGPAIDACPHGLKVEVGEGRLEPCDVSDLHAAERSGGGEPAQPRAGACEQTQSAVESAPESRASLCWLDGLGVGPRHWLPASAFAFATLATRFGVRLRDIGYLLRRLLCGIGSSLRQGHRFVGLLIALFGPIEGNKKGAIISRFLWHSGAAGRAFCATFQRLA